LERRVRLTWLDILSFANTDRGCNGVVEPAPTTEQTSIGQAYRAQIEAQTWSISSVALVGGYFQALSSDVGFSISTMTSVHPVQPPGGLHDEVLLAAGA
jgi:hypothetical protein